MTAKNPLTPAGGCAMNGAVATIGGTENGLTPRKGASE